MHQNNLLCYGHVKGPDLAALIDLLAGRRTEIELDRAALQIARIEYPDLDADAAIAELDRHAFAIAERARDLSDGQHFVETASRYLFEEAGFQGNQEDYYNPDNSCLNRVLETKRGIPITLSVVYIEVARRLAKKVKGVGLPGHFIVRYDDFDYAAWMDPFHGGRLLTLEDCCRLAQTEEIEIKLLGPVDNRHVAMRMLNNLRGIYFARKDGEKALEILDLLIAAAPESADEHKQRGVALLHQQRTRESLGAFQRYLELWPDAPDREAVEEQMRSISFWLASRN